MKKVVFDSNVWRQVSNPEKFHGNKMIAAYKAIHQACRDARIAGYVAETVFSLEQIKRDDRLQWLQESFKAGSITPGTWDVVRDHLNAALDIGIQILRVNRIGAEKSALLSSAMFLDVGESDFHRINDRFGEVASFIETFGAGMAAVKKYGDNSLSGHRRWLRNIMRLKHDEEQKKKIAEAVSEWADGDFVATAIAHETDIICSNDLGRYAPINGISSVFSEKNRKILERTYPIRFMDPQELFQEL